MPVAIGCAPRGRPGARGPLRPSRVPAETTGLTGRALDIPLFPLRTVLFPDGLLPLRVFEPRYMDMVRERMRANGMFGVCLIRRGGEVGAPAETEEVGCLATIVDWDMQVPGVLLIRARGTQRFRIQARRVEPDGLQRAVVTLLAPDVDGPVGGEYAGCVALLQRVIADLLAQRGADAALPLAEPHRLDSSVWVGNRLCEVLPIPLAARQQLMALEDADARLQLVDRYLRQHEVIR